MLGGYGVVVAVVAGVEGLPDPVVAATANRHISPASFTTLGCGNSHPATPAMALLATLESVFGALPMAFLVFVLGRRATW